MAPPSPRRASPVTERPSAERLTPCSAPEDPDACDGAQRRRNAENPFQRRGQPQPAVTIHGQVVGHGVSSVAGTKKDAEAAINS